MQEEIDVSKKRGLWDFIIELDFHTSRTCSETYKNDLLSIEGTI